jgi:hypothetical protein
LPEAREGVQVRVGLRPTRSVGEGQAQDVADVVDEVDGELCRDTRGDVVGVDPVGLREDDGAGAGAVGGEAAAVERVRRKGPRIGE